MRLKGAEIVVECLIENGTDIIFGYPGGAVIPIYDALYDRKDRIKHILTSHEQGAAHAADGYARVKKKTGVCIATSGPGATNLVTGIATAYMDSTPMVAITGNVSTDLIGKDSFQEVDILGITMPITKHNYQVTKAEDIARTIREAFIIAETGRPGPVLVDITKDALMNECEFEESLPEERIKELRAVVGIDKCNPKIVKEITESVEYAVKLIEERTNTVELSQKSVFVLKDDVREKYARYYVENVFEELKEPGEWYLNKKTGMLYYIPKEGEDPENTEVIVPYLEHILILQGSPEEGRYIHNVGFTGIQFSFTENDRTEVLYTREDKERWLQAAFDVSAAIHVMGAKECSFRECKVNRTGGYGIELSYGCTDNLIAGNEISDMGAGGIKINGADANGPACKRTGKNKITDNRIFNGGHIFHSGVGICSMHSFKNIIAHNDIQDLYYSGISCGWIWGYHDNISRENIIDKNHIHHLGKGLLSDMGGIYLLGIQPGTVVRGNLIHDIEKCNYGGWAIYTDEGCSHVLIENNICYDTNSQVFDQHYGRENIVRNNIFAFGEEGVVRLLRNEGHKQFSFYRNILITNGKPVFIGTQEKVLEKGNFFSDLNLFYDMSQKEPFCWIQKGYSFKEFSDEDKIMMRQWNDLDYDRHSLICDPLFKDIQNRDFALHSNSPAFDLGFQPIDNSDAGPREDYENSLHLDKKTDEEWRA
jgi:hypothetical protein